MSTRRFEVSFWAELDDRQVEAMADNLFDLGVDNIQFRPIPEPSLPPAPAPVMQPKRCFVCGDTYINWGAHAERCYGPPVGVRGRGGEKEDA